jgi:hypothetical protein
VRLVLPRIINAAGLLPFLSRIGVEPFGLEIELDFTELRRVSPAALVALSARVGDWRRRGIEVRARGLERCSILGYLQRMDLLRTCGLRLPENFTRHDERGRFVPVRAIDHSVESMASDMALCVAPGGDTLGAPLADLYDLVWYFLSELGNNVRQHSGGLGFASAQTTAAAGLVFLAIADNGRGIRGSFREAGFPWANDIDDAAAILWALEPKVSSKGSPNNEGVGLTLTTQLAIRTSAWLMIVSGRGVLRLNPRFDTIQVGVLPAGGKYHGTLVAVTVPQRRVGLFAQLLHEAKISSGLLRPALDRATFQM